MGFWDSVTAENLEDGYGQDKPIPSGTKLRAAIVEAKWDTFEDNPKYVQLTYEVLEGEFQGKKLWQKIKVYDTDAKKASRQRTMLAAIDKITKSGLLETEGEPTDSDLYQLINKVLQVEVAVWNSDGNTGNWIKAVAPDEDDIPF